MPLPGLRRLDHVGLTVPDLDEAHRFLVDVLGCEYLYSLGPFQHDDSDWMSEHLDVHPRAVMVENRWFRVGDQAVLEVFCYTSPDQQVVRPRNSDVGGHHLAFYVDDLDAAVEHLRREGVSVLAAPPSVASSGEVVSSWCWEGGVTRPHPAQARPRQPGPARPAAGRRPCRRGR